MSKKKNSETQPNSQTDLQTRKNKNKNKNNVAQFPTKCLVCRQKSVRVNFCEEHFLWFKEGLINRQGEKPKDFNKKYEHYLKKQAA